MKCFSYPIVFGLFTNQWCWFEDPHDIGSAAVVSFFSYHKVDTPTFRRREGLTTVIDLRAPLETLWEKMRKKFTSDLILEGRKKGIAIRQDENFRAFRPLYRRFRRKKDIVADNPKAFANGILFSAYDGDDMIAGHVFIGDGTYLRSWVAASVRLEKTKGKDRRRVGCANRMLVWEAIVWAKEKGYALVDLGGINPESDHSDERTLAEFKESFGGERRPCYYYRQINSPLLRLLRKFRKSFTS